MGNGQGKNEKGDRKEELLEAFKAVYAETGLKLTHQRFEIFKVLTHSADHPSVEDIFEKVKRRVPTISLDTVYRTLTTLEQSGVLSRVRLETRTRFDTNLIAHHHFVCKECNRIEDFYWPVFDRMRLRSKLSTLGKVDTRHVEIRGICEECRKARSKP